MDKASTTHGLRWRAVRVVLIVVIGIVGLVALLLRSGWLTRVDAEANEVIVEAVDGEGHSMAWIAAPYPLAIYEGRRWPFPGEYVPHGWAWSAVGDPLSLEFSGPLSDDSFDPEAALACPIGVDPREMAAMVNHALAIKYPGANTAIDTPLHPIGKFFSSELPGGGQIFLRLPRGSAPAEVTATLGNEVLTLDEIEPREVLERMVEGNRAEASSNDGMLEEHVIWADCHSYLAQERLAEKPAAFEQAVEVLNAVLAKFKERHGYYPQQLSDLIAVPGAVISRLPMNPYDLESQLGLKPAGHTNAPTIEYFPIAGSAGVVTDYELRPVLQED